MRRPTLARRPDCLIPVMLRTDALIAKLSEIHPKGFDLSLDRILALLGKLGNPHQAIPPAFHVAGTNGKGSTIAFLRSILEASSRSVHVHTSPHLVNWSERYRLAGTLVDDKTLADAISRASDANSGKPITIFEIMSAVAFILFSEHEADYSLLEVGLGGRFDATNVIEKPIACLITPVAMDHQAYLGDTIEKIAFEKAGIIKPGIPVIVGPQHDGAREIIEAIAEERGSPCIIAGQDFDHYQDATGFVFQDENGLLDLPLPALVGDHQLANAAVAIAAVRATGIATDLESVSKAMRQVTWPGRLESLEPGHIAKKLSPDVSLLVDGGHNPAAGQAIATELKRRIGPQNSSLILVCAMLTTKEPLGYFQPFSGLADYVITVPVTMSEAGYPPEELAQIAREAGLTALSASSLDEALEHISQHATSAMGATILFCGSLYFVGEVLQANGTPPN